MPFPDSQYPSVLRGYDKRQSERLLNAAPDLLDACRYLLRTWATRNATPEAYLRVCKAVAKAEGQ